jgi:hypothetical protein
MAQRAAGHASCMLFASASAMLILHKLVAHKQLNLYKQEYVLYIRAHSIAMYYSRHIFCSSVAIAMYRQYEKLEQSHILCKVTGTTFKFMCRSWVGLKDGFSM